MRILHTSDWHAGKTWKTINRLNEVAAALDHLARTIEREKIDLLLHTGDVFDASVPLAEAERVVFEFLKRVGRTGTRTIVIAGNHDNAARMAAWGLLAELVNVTTVPRPVRPDQGGVIEITTRDGERAVVAALPFASTGLLVSAREIAASDGTAFATYDQGMRAMLQRLTAAFRTDAVNLVMAHTYLEGVIIAGSERRATVGREWATTPQALPTRAHYVALGHIHKPQRVGAAPSPAYYAGSILQMEFDEAGQEKSFVRIEAHPGRPAVIDRVPYEGTIPLVRIQATLPEIETQVDALRSRGHLEVTITLDRHDPDLNTKVRRALPNAVSVRQRVPEQPQDVPTVRHGLPPRDLFTLYYRQQHHGAPTDAVLAAFDALYREAEEGG